MKENTKNDGFSAMTAIEIAKLKPIMESLVTIEANQRAIMWGQSALLHFASEKQFSIPQWQQKLADRARIEMESLSPQSLGSLNALAAMLEKMTGPKAN